MTRSLELIGYWREVGSNTSWLHPRDLIDESWERDNKAKIVRYLKSGIRINEDLGFSHCRFSDGPPDEMMGDAELTDGVWLWPEGLAVYVERYHVKLPAEFVAHMRANDYRMRPESDPHTLANLPVSSSFWESWCNQNRCQSSGFAMGSIWSFLKRALKGPVDA
ncbi:MAG: hypothetical protein HQ567_06175 [Candidatus Nealsonbacteria bacterium]|nr:hypothetical protein [Candidatus Nealsonbacteria bacterium]